MQRRIDRKFKIRQANTDDIPAIVSLYANATRLMHRLSPQGFGKRLGEPLDLEKEKENFSKALEDDKTVILVAEVDTHVAGFVMGAVEDYQDDLLDSPYLTVQYVCVDEGFRKQGIAKALMKEIEKWAQKEGIANLDLMVWDTNVPARSLFMKMGYVRLDIRMGKKLRN